MAQFLSLLLRLIAFIPVEKPAEPVVIVEPATVKAAEVFYSPQSLSIPSISLNAPILAVGADVDGTQLVPSDKRTTSWWKHGTKPGEKGSAVIAGHYKIDDGSPGVFYRLNEVKVGEIVSVLDENGAEQKFQVAEKKIFEASQFPVAEVYSQKDAKKLNIVTCTGTFLANKNDYSHRLVVYTIKVN